MGINIDNYKKLSRKIKIGGISGYGKEYGIDELNLIFEGEYLNGERNGKGKEYICRDRDLKLNIFYANFKLIFEGEYLNGKRNGKGKEYNDYNGKLEFEGEYLNGKRNGKGKEYNYYNGKLIFEGEYLNGLKILGIKG